MRLAVCRAEVNAMARTLKSGGRGTGTKTDAPRATGETSGRQSSGAKEERQQAGAVGNWIEEGDSRQLEPAPFRVAQRWRPGFEGKNDGRLVGGGGP